MKKNGIKISPAGVNMLTTLADGRRIDRARSASTIRTAQALLTHQLITPQLAITPAGLDMIGRQP